MQHVTLNNGVEMPILGFGVYQIPDGTECEQAVRAALDAGYRLLDTAAAYGNEEAVGRAIAASGVPREEIFVTTKVWIQDAGEQATRRAFDASRAKLNLDHIDLYLIHQPYGDVYGSWRAMEKLLGDGLVRAIGVSNFHADRLVDLVDHNDVTPAVNQVECHVFHQRPDLEQTVDDLGVQLEAWGPFAEGKNDMFAQPVLSRLAAGHGVSVAQVILRWLVQRGIVVIPKSSRPERMAENIDVFGFELSADDMAAIAQLDTGESLFLDHRDPRTVHKLGTRTIGD